MIEINLNNSTHSFTDYRKKEEKKTKSRDKTVINKYTLFKSFVIDSIELDQLSLFLNLHNDYRLVVFLSHLRCDWRWKNIITLMKLKQRLRDMNALASNHVARKKN